MFSEFCRLICPVQKTVINKFRRYDEKLIAVVLCFGKISTCFCVGNQISGGLRWPYVQVDTWLCDRSRHRKCSKTTKHNGLRGYFISTNFLAMRFCIVAFIMDRHVETTFSIYAYMFIYTRLLHGVSYFPHATTFLTLLLHFASSSSKRITFLFSTSHEGAKAHHKVDQVQPIYSIWTMKHKFHYAPKAAKQHTPAKQSDKMYHG